ncbi:Putative membrane protein [Erwinia tasmaniensis Et1/99]|uniref:Membrane protein n=2 Tax=Erwinia tasmaniensis TaxID=338565 RepID=B2VH86_ERWT9|nr:Putative membrane protein [Erwinia tasmaniensis Et1/99]
MMLGKRLDSGWGVLVPCAMMPLLALMELSFSEWRLLMVVAFLATVIMLFHKRLRHYLLLPSCIALAGGLAAISVNFNGV